MITVNVQAIREAACHRPPGYFEDVLSAGRVDGDYVHIPTAAFDGLMIKYSGYPLPCGPGCQLKRLLSAFGLLGRPGCQCEARATVMDLWGVVECSKPERIAEVVSWLKEEAAARGLPFSEAVAGVVVRRAISAAKSHEKMSARKLHETPPAPPPSSAAV